MAIFKNYKKVFIGAIVVVVFIITMLFFLRNYLLHSKIDSIQKHYKNDLHTDLLIKDAGFSGLNNINATGIIIKPEDGDTLLTVDSISASVNVFKIIFGKISLTNLSVYNTNVSIIKNQKEANYSFLFRKNERDSLNAMEKDYSTLINDLVSKVFDKIPNNLNLVKFKLTVNRNNKDKFSMLVPNARITNGTAAIDTMMFLENKKKYICSLDGVINSDNKSFAINFKNNDAGKFHLEFLEKWKQLNLAVHSFHLEFNEYNHSMGQTYIHGNIIFNNLLFNHPKLTTTDASISNLGFDFKFTATKNSLVLDSASEIKIDKILFRAYLNINKSSKKKEYELKLRMPDTDATDFFSSLPNGMFDNTNQIKAKGKLAYNLDFFMDTDQPDSLKFSASLNSSNFKIIHLGKTDFTKLNSSFEYTPYSYGIAQPSFLVGPENPMFTPIEHISPYLKNSVLNSEDGIFYYHKGFIEQAFAQSIAANFKTGKFTRGGSTLTMQLVKNVFLSKNKNIGRKLEEALIVWLIENNNLSSKDRMFEVYLNIIEWGPGIYGIAQASNFYFNKRPADLSLSESIFLASIIPAPKWFKYAFDDSGKLKEDRLGYFKVMSEILFKKGIITDEMHDSFQPSIELKGRAKVFLAPKDSIPPDSLLMNDAILF